MKVTTKKHMGDDAYSWAVFVNCKVVEDLTGLNRSQATYYKKMILEREAAKGQQLDANPS